MVPVCERDVSASVNVPSANPACTIAVKFPSMTPPKRKGQSLSMMLIPDESRKKLLESAAVCWDVPTDAIHPGKAGANWTPIGVAGNWNEGCRLEIQVLKGSLAGCCGKRSHRKSHSQELSFGFHHIRALRSRQPRLVGEHNGIKRENGIVRVIVRESVASTFCERARERRDAVRLWA